MKAEAQKDSVNVRMKTTSKPKLNVQFPKTNSLGEGEELKKFEGMPYEDNLSDEENDDDDDDDFSDEEYEDEDLLPGVEDDEEVMTQCPDYCKCAGQYAAATTATYVSNRIII